MTPSTQTQTYWLLCAVAAAGARFVPVPLLDDVVKGRANRTAVGLALGAAGKTYPTTWVAPLYSTGSLLDAIAGLPLKLVLFPIRRIVRIVGAVKGVPTDLLETWLLGRGVYSAALAGALDGDEATLELRARAVRAAFDQAFEGLNVEVLSKALGQALGQIRGLGETAVRISRQLLGDRPPTGHDPADEGLTDAIHEVEDLLEQEDVKSALAEFDRRFETAWRSALDMPAV